MGKRDDILGAALRIVARGGIQSLTMARIQDESGAGSGTMYNYFDSKETLLRALYENAMDAMNEQVLEGFTGSGDARADFTDLMRRFLDYAAAHFDRFNFTDQYSFFVLRGAARDIPDDPKHLFSVSKQIIAAGQAEGLIKPIDFAALQRIVSGVIVACAQSFYLGDLAPSEELKDGIVNACWDAVRA
jgi:AcrR family transcriptional regulator